MGSGPISSLMQAGLFTYAFDANRCYRGHLHRLSNHSFSERTHQPEPAKLTKWPPTPPFHFSRWFKLRMQLRAGSSGDRPPRTTWGMHLATMIFHTNPRAPRSPSNLPRSSDRLGGDGHPTEVLGSRGVSTRSPSSLLSLLLRCFHISHESDKPPFASARFVPEKCCSEPEPGQPPFHVGGVVSFDS